MAHPYEASRDIIITGQQFLESPRWHDGLLYLSDVLGGQVLTWDPGTGEVIERLVLDGDRACGLGFSSDGRGYVASVLRRNILDLDTGSVVADLSSLTIGGVNDIVITPADHIIVGSFGYDVMSGAKRAPGNLVMFSASDPSPRVVADELWFPNGMVADDGTLLVAELSASLISAFTITASGDLTNRRVWCELPQRPDGICRGPDGDIWAAMPRAGAVARITADGRHTETLSVREGWEAVATGIGGPDGRTLFVTTSRTEDGVTSSCVESYRIG